jgi:hypothetical protein
MEVDAVANEQAHIIRTDDRSNDTNGLGKCSIPIRRASDSEPSKRF